MDPLSLGAILAVVTVLVLFSGVSVAVGGNGGEGGAGGAVTVTNGGGVSTGGFAADAIYAASTGCPRARSMPERRSILG